MTVPPTLASAAMRADILITLLAATGAFAYLAHLAARPQRSLIESRTRLLVLTAGALCAVRALAWAYPHRMGVQIVAFLPATLLPLAMTLFVEGLLRRHVPLGVKMFGAALGFAALLVNAFRPLIGAQRTNAMLGASFAIGLLLHMATLGVILLRRDRRSLSRAENGFVDAMLWTAAVAVPLAATDFRPALGWPPNRMGGLAVLLFVFTALRPARARARRRSWLYDVGRLAGIALLGVAAFVFVAGPPPSVVLVHWTSVAIAVVLLAAVLQRMRELRAGERHRPLHDWIAEPVPASLEQFARSLRRLPLTADAMLLGEEQLGAYEAAEILQPLRGGSGVHSHGSLAPPDGASRGREELLDLLERHGRTHVALIREHPVLLLLVSAPELSGAGEVDAEIATVVRRAQHVLALEASAASGASHAH